MSASRPHLLHVFSTFNVGGPQVRATRMMNAWGDSFRHSIVSLGIGEYGARDRVASGVDVDFPDFPDSHLGALPARLLQVRRRLAELRPDLVLTYNWGATEVVMTRRLFGGAPLVHHEGGFGPEESTRQLPRRVLFRRLALPGARSIVVPSHSLERIARGVWRQPAGRVKVIANGVDCDAFAVDADPLALPGLDRRDGVLQVGTVTALRREKNLPRLVRAFARASEGLQARLVIVGGGAEDEAIRRQASDCGIAERVHLVGPLQHPERFLPLFDVFALTSDTEQFPNSLAEAMAARLPAVCTAVGDVRQIVAAENLPYVFAPDDERALAAGLRRLLDDAELRGRLGSANLERARRAYSLQTMIDAYGAVYREALGPTPQ